MNRKKRNIIGVIAAEASSIEQRQIIMGIAARAIELGFDTAVITNIYNPTFSDDELYCENNIYELIMSDDLDALILISESFVNEGLRHDIAGYLKKKNMPVIVLGTYIPELDLPNCTLLNTSDENDIFEAAEHLIKVHNIDDIDILTGQKEIDASRRRVDGYRKALESNGITFDEKKVHYGDFWMTSGTTLADKYVSGEIRMPKAVICANDYMAYGLLDRFEELGVNVPETISVIGYEYIGDRMLHTPLLTTYQRSRSQLGRAAVDMIHCRMNGEEYEFTPPKDTIIYGNTCPCGYDRTQYGEELRKARISKDYDFWNLFNPLDQKLIKCRTVDDFVDTCGSLHWLVRNTHNIFFCLCSDWYETEEHHSDIISCRSIMPWLDRTPHETGINDIAGLFADFDRPALYYFTPMFFSKRYFGHIVLRYDEPDAYDHIYRNWLKSLSNGLEFLRMKNDIRYLTQCQNLSEQRDTLTGMYNENGLRKAYETFRQRDGLESCLVMLRICVTNDSFTELEGRINALMDAAEAVRQFCGSNDTCGRIAENTFACLIHSSLTEEQIVDKLSAILVQHNVYTEKYGIDSFLCETVFTNGRLYHETVGECLEGLSEKQRLLNEMRQRSHYREMLRIRNFIYLNPQESFSTDNLRKMYPYSSGHLRELYKKCFGVSIHQDCIAARIARAKYFLTVTQLSMADVAEKCGYLDNKYFLRQFLASVGMTPNSYRNTI